MEEKIRQKLLKLEKTSENFWNIPPETGNHLNMLIKAANYKNIIEVGTSNGYSTIWLAEAAKNISGYVITIEYFEQRVEMARQNIEDAGLADYVTIKTGKAIDIIESIDSATTFDFAFIDANKAEYIKYFELLDARLKSNGMIAADNVTSHKTEMQNFLKLIHGRHDYQCSYLPFGGGILLALKKNGFCK